jgi:Methyltransferase domain
VDHLGYYSSGDETVIASRRRAYVFYATNDLYAVAILVFVQLLRRLGIADDTDVVALHLSLSADLLDRMRRMQIVTRRVPGLPRVDDRHCRDCLVKLRVFELTEYDQVVYVDADAIPLRRLDHLFELRFAEPLAASAAYWMPQPWWGSHLLVVKPAAKLWERVQRHIVSATRQPLHDMDIVNREFGREIHTLSEETVCLNSEWEDGARPGAFTLESLTRVAVAHFSALGKPWAHTPGDVRRLRPNAHPMFYRLWEMWWETREEVFRSGEPSPAMLADRGRDETRAPQSGPTPGAGLRSRESAGPEGERGAPITLGRAYDFHRWFERLFRHRLGVRYRTFFQALLLALLRNATTIVETGTARQSGNWTFDGQSTVVLGAFAQRYGSRLWTCDADASHMARAQDLTAPFAQQIEYVVSDSVEFLRRFSGPIDLLYLDAVDFDEHAPEAAQDHALREGQAALPALHEDSIVLIDDCNVPQGGKGGRLIPFLLSRGWKVVGRKYQVLLARSAAGGP